MGEGVLRIQMRSRRLGKVSKPPRVENTSSGTTGLLRTGVEENGELGVRYGSDVRLVELADKLAATGFALAIFTIAPS
jgi:hypothetical protein